jgi:hypothetical protein
MALDVAGVFLEALGVALAGVGLWQTWQKFAPEGEGLLDPLRQLSARIMRAARRRLGRPAGQVVNLRGVATGSGTVRARGRVQYPPLKEGMATELAIAELDRRVRQLVDTVSNAHERLADELEEARRESGELAGRLANEVTRLEQQGVRVAVGGVRLQASGLFLVAVGLGLQLLASLVG